MDRHLVESYDVGTLSPADEQRGRELSELVWPPATLPDFSAYASAAPPARDWPHAQRSRELIVRDERGVMVARARVGPREIATTRGRMVVMELAGVLSHPDYRGRGLGKAVVGAAFGLVDQGAFDCAFFQTGVPEFYLKLGCREVHNPLINSLAANPGQTPFWDKHAMIYPADFDWPDGPIDTLGPGW